MVNNQIVCTYLHVFSFINYKYEIISKIFYFDRPSEQRCSGNMDQIGSMYTYVCCIIQSK